MKKCGIFNYYNSQIATRSTGPADARSNSMKGVGGGVDSVVDWGVPGDFRVTGCQIIAREATMAGGC